MVNAKDAKLAASSALQLLIASNAVQENSLMVPNALNAPETARNATTTLHVQPVMKALSLTQQQENVKVV